MIKKTSFTVIAVGALFLVGCEKTPKSVDFYKEPVNNNTLKSVLADCQKSGDDTKDCQNAKIADHMLKQANAPIPTFGDDGKVLTKEQARKEKTFYPVNGVSFPKSIEGLTPEEIKSWKSKGVTKQEMNAALDLCQEIKDKDMKLDTGCRAILFADTSN
ncbi:hypothetical protein BUE93_22150 [Chromobacterium amazonense]|uniref:EexN family lipoprotein n=1 Tax=Chromobacterium amazonense TaxID=1382803 RepID=A0A2S9WYG5_9NEIS|nr:EexN family lipoprotein [Chromobacterium amazonense]PRP68505.1 hypothetical protein BUE93_22150 [Chromobacterium amazonense]